MRFFDRLKDKHWNTKAKYILLIDDVVNDNKEEFHLTGSEYTLEEAKQILDDTKVLIKHCKRKTSKYYDIFVGVCCLFFTLPLLTKFNFVYWGTWFANGDEKNKAFLIVLYVMFCILIQLLLIIWPFYLDWLPGKLIERNEKEIERLNKMKTELKSKYNI